MWPWLLFGSWQPGELSNYCTALERDGDAPTTAWYACLGGQLIEPLIGMDAIFLSSQPWASSAAPPKMKRRAAAWTFWESWCCSSSRCFWCFSSPRGGGARWSQSAPAAADEEDEVEPLPWVCSAPRICFSCYFQSEPASSPSRSLIDCIDSPQLLISRILVSS